MKRCMRSPLFQPTRRETKLNYNLKVAEKESEREREKMGTLRVPDVLPSVDQDCERLNKAFDGVSFSLSEC